MIYRASLTLKRKEGLGFELLLVYREDGAMNEIRLVFLYDVSLGKLGQDGKEGIHSEDLVKQESFHFVVPIRMLEIQGF